MLTLPDRRNSPLESPIDVKCESLKVQNLYDTSVLLIEWFGQWVPTLCGTLPNQEWELYPARIPGLSHRLNITHLIYTS